MVIAEWVTRESEFILLEEPEIGLHPHLTEQISELLSDAAETTQIFVTTHNPDFLDYLDPESVLMCDKIEGVSRLMRAEDVEQIDTFRKQFLLGQLWTQGVLGGTP